jgi:hypothetical protein
VCIRYRGNVSTEPLPSNDRWILPNGCLATIRGFLRSRYLEIIRGYTYRHTTDGRNFLNYAVEMGSDAVIYVPSFIKIGSGVQKLIGNTHGQQHDLISLLYFYKIRKVG